MHSRLKIPAIKIITMSIFFYIEFRNITFSFNNYAHYHQNKISMSFQFFDVDGD